MAWKEEKEKNNVFYAQTTPLNDRTNIGEIGKTYKVLYVPYNNAHVAYLYTEASKLVNRCSSLIFIK